MAMILTRACWLVPTIAVAYLAMSTPQLAAQENDLIYRMSAGQEFAYDIEIVAEDPDRIVTYKGVATYKVDTINDQQIRLTYQGGLNESSKAKAQPRRGGGPPFGPGGFPGPPGIGGPPGFPRGGPFARATFAGKQQTTNHLTMTLQGKTVAMDGDSQLPFLLGNVSLLPFEMLPSDRKPAWTVDSGINVTEKNENRGFFGPFSPFGNQNETTQSGQESTRYEIIKQEPQTIAVKKSYQLSTPKTQDNPAFEIAGTGTWTFARVDHLPQSLDFQQKLIIRDGNEAVTIPITIKYSRMTSEALANHRAEEKRRHEELMKKLAEAKAAAAKTPKAANDLSRKYLDGSTVPASNLSIPDKIKLPKGLIIAHQWPTGEWHGAEVIEDLPDGQIKFQEIGWSRKTYTHPRDKLQLAPMDVDQPPQVNKARLMALHRRSTPSTASSDAEVPLREWTDSAGTKKIQAAYLSSENGKVRIRLADGRELNVSLDKFSAADREYVKKMEGGDDPFK